MSADASLGTWLFCPCIAAALLVALGGVALWFKRRSSAVQAPPGRPTEADMRRELALSLAVMMAEGQPPPASPAADPQELARSSRFGELLALARAWKASGAKARNPAAFNDLLRALDAIAEETG